MTPPDQSAPPPGPAKPRGGWRRWMRRGCLISLQLTVVAAITLLCWPATFPLAPSIVRVRPGAESIANSKASHKTLTVRWQNHGAHSVVFAEEQQVRFRVAGRWLEPEIVPGLKDRYLGPGTNRFDLAVIAPAQADDCEFLLNWRVGSPPYCRAYLFMNHHGLDKRFPALSRWVTRRFPRRSQVQPAEVELAIPALLDSAKSPTALRSLLAGDGRERPH